MLKGETLLRWMNEKVALIWLTYDIYGFEVIMTILVWFNGSDLFFSLLQLTISSCEG